jgi:hypothetical protein
MGLLDRAKDQAIHLTDREKIREVAEKVRGRVEDIQTKRRADALLEDLGRLVYAQHTGRVNAGAETEMNRLVAELRILEDDGLPILPRP